MQIRWGLKQAALACCAISLASLAQADTQMSLTAYQPLQYEAAPSFPLGPWGRPNLSGALVLSCKKLQQQQTSMRRFLCVSKATDLTLAELEQLLDTPHFLLLLVPSPEAAVAAAATSAAAWAAAETHIRQIETLLLDRHSTAAVAFAHETPDLQILLDRLQSDEEVKEVSFWKGTLQRSHFVAQSSAQAEAHLVQNIRGVSLTTWIRGKTLTDGRNPPTLLIVAHHDAFSPVPHFATGLSNSASGTIGLMWLARELKLLFSGSNTPEYNIAFLLSDASSLNFEGIAQWLGQTDPSILNGIRYVLCLDSLDAPSLVLHTPKIYKDLEVSRFLKTIETALNAEGVEVNTRVKKLAVADQVRLFWSHDRFTLAKLMAGSLSTETNLKHWWNRSSLLDAKINEAALVRNIRGLTEGIAQFLLKVEGGEGPSRRLTSRHGGAPLEAFVYSWAKYSAAAPRFFAYRQLNNYSNKKQFFQGVADELTNAGFAVERHEFAVDLGGFSFFYVPPVTISIAEARSVLFDWLLLLLAATYSLGVYFLIKTIARTNIISRDSKWGSSPVSPEKPSAAR